MEEAKGVVGDISENKNKSFRQDNDSVNDENKGLSQNNDTLENENRILRQNNDSIDDENKILRQELDEVKQQLAEIKSLLAQNNNNTPAVSHASPTDMPSETPSLPLFSIGNEGVPTNKQTDIQPTLEALNSLKTELKVKFRNLTRQEFRVFSAVYIMEQQQHVDYRSLAEKLRLSEGSIRDYIMKMERKGIPIHKEKINNKKVILHIRQELRELAPLEAIMNFREPLFK